MAQAALVNPSGAGVQKTLVSSLLNRNGNEYATATAAAVVVTFDPDNERPTILRQLMAGYGATPAAGATLQVEDGSGNVIWKMGMVTAVPQTFTFDPPLAGTKGTTMIVTLSSGAGAVVGYLFANAYREQ